MLDTYAAALGADASDCDPKDVSAFIAAIQKHLLTTCTVLILHHFGKDSSRGGRGWSGLRAALDFELEIDRDRRAAHHACNQIARRLGQATRLLLSPRRARTRHERIRRAGHGRCGRAPGRRSADAAKRGKRIKPGTRAALNVLWDMIKDRSSKSFPMADQPGLRCVMFTAWEFECTKDGGISKSPDMKQRRRMFREAVEELEQTGLIELDAENGGRVYPRSPRNRATPTARDGGTKPLRMGARTSLLTNALRTCRRTAPRKPRGEHGEQNDVPHKSST